MKTETAGVVALHVSLKFDVAQLANWTPERIAALFDGIAKVQAATQEPPKEGISDAQETTRP